MTEKPPAPATPDLLQPQHVERPVLQEINKEIPDVLDWLSSIQSVDVDGVEPYDVSKALRPAVTPTEKPKE